VKIFLYEFVTGGGTWHTRGSLEPAGSLLVEGAAMTRAAAADLASLPGIEVVCLLDARLVDRIPPFDEPAPTVRVVDGTQEELTAFDHLTRHCDATFLIAPEIGGILLHRCRRVEALGGKLLSPDSHFVALAADKQAATERLAKRGVRVPKGVRLGAAATAPADLFPAVLKPCDGAGSWLVGRVEDAGQLQHALTAPELAREQARGNLRLERFVSGIAASVAALCGPRRHVLLEPCEQRLDRNFTYLGGRLPLPGELAARARHLAAAALAALPTTTGYFGIDMVLGEDPFGRDDYIIEINPRLTTSYVGLRAAYRANLCGILLEGIEHCRETVAPIAEPLGRKGIPARLARASALAAAAQPIEFWADGRVYCRGALPVSAGTAGKMT
jgi:hypothetical protein